MCRIVGETPRPSWETWASIAMWLAVQTALVNGQTESPQSALDQLRETYRIEIVTSGWVYPVSAGGGQITGQDAEPTDLEVYIPLLIQEFSLYPPELIRRSKLKAIVLGSGIAFAGQARNAIPDFGNNTLYLEVSRGRHHPLYLRKVIHHEFFHLVDYRDDGQVYRDDEWARLNPPDFSYGSGGRNSQDRSDTSVLTDRYPGFLNHYSTTGVEEDKAEVFANLMVEPKYVHGRSATDAVLRAKVEQMQRLLGKFCPKMGADFWARVRAHPR